MALSDSFVNDWLEEWNGSEKYVAEAIQQLSSGNDGDETYHPLYKAWRSLQHNPSQLKSIQDYGKYGTGLMIFLSYGTVKEIDDRQQLASISYLFLSKALRDNPFNANLLKNRLALMIYNHEALQYTVSSVVNKDVDIAWIDSWMDSNFKPRDAMFKMEYADLSKDSRLLSIDMLSSQYTDLKNKIHSGFFGKNESEESIIEAGNKHHQDLLEYLENKVIKEGDISF